MLHIYRLAKIPRQIGNRTRQSRLFCDRRLPALSGSIYALHLPTHKLANCKLHGHTVLRCSGSCAHLIDHRLIRASSTPNIVRRAPARSANRLKHRNSKEPNSKFDLIRVSSTLPRAIILSGPQSKPYQLVTGKRPVHTIARNVNLTQIERANFIAPNARITAANSRFPFRAPTDNL